MRHFFIVFLVGIAIFGGGCAKYKSHVILKVQPEDINWLDAYQEQVDAYRIRKGDRIQFTIYTNSGEAIIDPSGQLVKPRAAGSEGSDPNTLSATPFYEVSEAGTCVFPVLGLKKVEGLKVEQLDSLLSYSYEEYYHQVFIVSKIVNKRVIVIGDKGSQVIPLDHPNMNLLEILALYGGLTKESKGFDIRIIRGDLKNPQVTLVNLQTIADMKSTMVNIKPDDIIYIEPVVKPFREAAQEYRFVFQMVNLLFTFALFIDRWTR